MSIRRVVGVLPWSTECLYLCLRRVLSMRKKSRTCRKTNGLKAVLPRQRRCGEISAQTRTDDGSTLWVFELQVTCLTANESSTRHKCFLELLLDPLFLRPHNHSSINISHNGSSNPPGNTNAQGWLQGTFNWCHYIAPHRH